VRHTQQMFYVRAIKVIYEHILRVSYFACKYLAHVPHTPFLQRASVELHRSKTHIPASTQKQKGAMHLVGNKERCGYNYPQVW